MSERIRKLVAKNRAFIRNGMFILMLPLLALVSIPIVHLIGEVIPDIFEHCGTGPSPSTAPCYTNNLPIGCTSVSIFVMPAEFSEGAGPGAGSGLVALDCLSNGVPVYLISNDTTEATVPTFVIIPSGVSTATFAIDAVDDDLDDGDQEVVISASISTTISADAAITVTDDELTALELPTPENFAYESCTLIEAATVGPATLSINLPVEEDLPLGTTVYADIEPKPVARTDGKVDVIWRRLTPPFDTISSESVIIPVLKVVATYAWRSNGELLSSEAQFTPPTAGTYEVQATLSAILANVTGDGVLLTCAQEPVLVTNTVTFTVRGGELISPNDLPGSGDNWMTLTLTANPNYMWLNDPPTNALQLTRSGAGTGISRPLYVWATNRWLYYKYNYYFYYYWHYYHVWIGSLSPNWVYFAPGETGSKAIQISPHLSSYCFGDLEVPVNIEFRYWHPVEGTISYVSTPFTFYNPKCPPKLKVTLENDTIFESDRNDQVNFTHATVTRLTQDLSQPLTVQLSCSLPDFVEVLEDTLNAPASYSGATLAEGIEASFDAPADLSSATFSEGTTESLNAPADFSSVTYDQILEESLNAPADSNGATSFEATEETLSNPADFSPATFAMQTVDASTGSVLIPAGHKSASFIVRAIDDDRPQGIRAALILAQADGHQGGKADINVWSDDGQLDLGTDSDNDGVVTPGPIDSIAGDRGASSPDDAVEDEQPNYFPINTADVDGDGNEDYRNAPAVFDPEAYPYVIISTAPEIWSKALEAKLDAPNHEFPYTYTLDLQFPDWNGDLCIHAFVSSPTGVITSMSDIELFNFFYYNPPAGGVKVYVVPRANVIGLLGEGSPFPLTAKHHWHHGGGGPIAGVENDDKDVDTVSVIFTRAEIMAGAPGVHPYLQSDGADAHRIFKRKEGGWLPLNQLDNDYNGEGNPPGNGTPDCNETPATLASLDGLSKVSLGFWPSMARIPGSSCDLEVEGAAVRLLLVDPLPDGGYSVAVANSPLTVTADNPYSNLYVVGIQNGSATLRLNGILPGTEKLIYSDKQVLTVGSIDIDAPTSNVMNPQAHDEELAEGEVDGGVLMAVSSDPDNSWTDENLLPLTLTVNHDSIPTDVSFVKFAGLSDNLFLLYQKDGTIKQWTSGTVLCIADGLPSELKLKATGPLNSHSLKAEYFVGDSVYSIYSTDSLSVTAVLIDIRMDIDSDGDIDSIDDQNEQSLGGVCFQNIDNDDASSIFLPDIHKSSVIGEDDLVEVVVYSPRTSFGTMTLTVSSTSIRLWESSDKNNQPVLMPLVLDVATTSFPITLYVEGYHSSSSVRDQNIKLEFSLNGVNSLVPDIILLTVVRLNLGIAVYRKMTISLLEDYEHAALVSEYTGRRLLSDLKDKFNWLTIEEAPGGIHTSNLHYFEAAKPPITGYCQTPNITDSQRNRIIDNAKRSLSLNFGYAYYGFGSVAIDWKGLTWDKTLEDIEDLRCDGLVEVCYELTGEEVWGKNATNYPIQNHPNEHNNFGRNSHELSPFTQRASTSSRFVTAVLYEPSLP